MKYEKTSPEEELRRLILERYRSVRAFCVAVGLPYSTVDNVMRRGILSINVTTAGALCDLLGLDVGAFIRGEILVAGDEEQRRWEQKLMESCRRLDEHGKQMVSMVAEKERERCIKEAQAVTFPGAGTRGDSWRQYVGMPIACRGGGVTAATEEDARQMEKLYRKLMDDKKTETGKG